ncbi:hypothetical protein HDV03_000251 [Kappamyces sp. JEL0829]|nr:hypothetical protein HDV03_000251 [Kappamyces sp. JEL0829]
MTRLIDVIKASFPTGSSTQDFTQFEKLAPSGLQEALLSEDPSVGALVAGFIAEWAKHEPTRSLWRELDCWTLLISLLEKTSDKPTLINCLRALANLCFDDGMLRTLIFDGNRDALLGLEGNRAIKTVVAVTKHPDIDIVFIAWSAILNISMDNELVQSSMVKEGLYSSILARLDAFLVQPGVPDTSKEQNTIVAILKVWSNVLEADDAQKALFASHGFKAIAGFVEKVRHLLAAPDLDQDDYEWIVEAMDAMSVVLETISENENAQSHMVHSLVVAAVMDFIDTKSSYTPEKDEDTDPAEDEHETTLESVKLLLAKVVTASTMSDSNMKYLITQSGVIERFLGWTKASGNGEKLDDEIRMTGALCIGNIARSDETCEKLVRTFHVVQPLLDVVKLEGARLETAKYGKDETKLVIKVIHAALGALKNLSLAVSVRATLGTFHVIENMVSLFQLDHIQPLHVSIVGIIKNLCAGTAGIDGNVYRVLTGQEPPAESTVLSEMPPHGHTPSPLSKLIKLIWTASKDNDGGVRNEGGRLIVHLVKCIHRSKGRPPDLTTALDHLHLLSELNALTLIIQILTGAHLTKSGSGSTGPDTDHHVQFDAPPETTRVFPLVQNESIVALTLLCSLHRPTASKILKFSAVVPTLLSILSTPLQDAAAKVDSSLEDMQAKKPIHSIQTMMNACLLLRYLVQEADFDYRKDVKSILGDQMRHIPQGTDPASPELQFQVAISQVLELL